MLVFCVFFFFLFFFHKNVCCVYLLESPHQGDSHEYIQHTIEARTTHAYNKCSWSQRCSSNGSSTGYERPVPSVSKDVDMQMHVERSFHFKRGDTCITHWMEQISETKNLTHFRLKKNSIPPPPPTHPQHTHTHQHTHTIYIGSRISILRMSGCVI